MERLQDELLGLFRVRQPKLKGGPLRLSALPGLTAGRYLPIIAGR